MSKAEATRLADALDFPFAKPSVKEQCDAAALLRQWPDGEPVAEVEADGVLRFKKTGRKWQVGDKLYTAPPNQSARIAELEAEVGDLRDSCAAKADRIDRLGETVVRLSAALKVAGEALWVCAEHNALHHGDQHNTTTQARTALQRIKEAQR